MDVASAHGKKILILTAVLLLAAITVSMYFWDIPDRDMAHRYIPMAEAFAARDFSYAFHPRIQPLQPVCGGIIAFLTGVDGFLALKIASAMWHIAGGVLLYILFRELYRDDRKVAVWGTVLYAFFPYMFHMSFSGLRESAKGFFLILITLALTRIRRSCGRWSPYILLGAACGLATLVRAELLAFSAFCLFCAAVFECEKPGIPKRAATATLISFLLTLINMIINRVYYGTTMPDVRYATLFRQLAGRDAGPLDAAVFILAACLLIPALGWAASKLLRRIKAGWVWLAVFALTAAVTAHTAVTGAKGSVGELLYVLLQALYYYVIGLALIHIVSIVWQKKMTREEHVVLIAVTANILLFTLQNQIFHRSLYLSTRYVFPVTPLLFGFFLLGWADIYRWLSPYLPRWFAYLGMAASIIGLCVMYAIHCPQPLYRSYHSRREVSNRRSLLEIKRMITEDYRGKRRSAAPRRALWDYQSRNHPKIWFGNAPWVSVITYLVDGSIARKPEDADYVIAVKLNGYWRENRRRLKSLGLVEVNDRKYRVWRVR